MVQRERILARLSASVDQLTAEATAAIKVEVPGYGGFWNDRLEAEVFGFTQEGIAQSIDVMRRRTMPMPDELEFVRQRAAQRARQLVPISGLLHGFLIANRVVARAVRAHATPTAAAYREALDLVGLAQEYTLAVARVMADTYQETIQGPMADRERQRNELLTAILASPADESADLDRTAAGLGLDLPQAHAVVVATLAMSPEPVSLRWAARAISRSTARPDQDPFVVIRGDEVVALLRWIPPNGVAEDLRRSARALAESHHGELVAGIGPPFTDQRGLRRSYGEARRALRHAGRSRPFVTGPDQVRLLDEFTMSAEEAVSDLIPEATRSVLSDPVQRATLEAFVEASLDVRQAAASLCIHPNTLRYRLRRIAEQTGRDPHRAADLFELVAAARILSGPAEGHGAGAVREDATSSKRSAAARGSRPVRSATRRRR